LGFSFAFGFDFTGFGAAAPKRGRGILPTKHKPAASDRRGLTANDTVSLDMVPSAYACKYASLTTITNEKANLPNFPGKKIKCRNLCELRHSKRELGL